MVFIIDVAKAKYLTEANFLLSEENIDLTSLATELQTTNKLETVLLS